MLDTLPFADQPSPDDRPVISPIAAHHNVAAVKLLILDSEKAYNAAGDRLFALRRLYNLARQAGGIGSDCAAERASQISKAR